MSYKSKCSEILDLFRASGKEVPHEDSDMGRAVQILQTICDSQSHTIPDANKEQETIVDELKENDWQIFEGNAACNPYAVKHFSDGSEQRHEHNEMLYVIAFAAQTANIDLDIASEIFEALEEIETKIHEGDYDFNLDFDGNEYRIISDSSIWEIYVEEIKQTVEDCYELNLDKIPSFVAVSIDWEETAKNAYADGYGHQFSSYDGSEEEAAGYYIFRTN